MKDLRKILLVVSVAVVCIAFVFGWRAWQSQRVEELLKSPDLVNALLKESVSYKGDTYIIPPTQIYALTSDQNAFPALTAPTFASVAEADEYLADDVYGVDVEVAGEHRFYSYQILNWHLVVNDTIGDKQLAITHCSLCRSPRVYERTFQGKELELSSSNTVYNNNVLLEDNQTNGLWMQMRGEGVTNDVIGESLTVYPFTVLTWSEWKNRYPAGKALSRNTGFTFDYTSHPYNNYDIAELVYFPMNQVSTALGSKWIVNGIDYNGVQAAFSKDVMKGKGVESVDLNGAPVVGLYDFDANFTRVFLAEVNDTSLTFTFDFEHKVLTDDQTGSHWNALGTAVDGDLQDTQLTQLYAPESFFLCWGANYPDTVIPGVTSIKKTDE